VSGQDLENLGFGLRFSSGDQTANDILEHVEERVGLSTIGDKEVICVNFSRAGPAEVDLVIEQAIPLIRTRPKGSVYTITDVTGMPIHKLSNRKLEDFVRGNKPYVRAAAVFGLSGVARAILATLKLLTGRELNAFGDRQAAEVWISAQ
jgi:hypothetical protein